MKHIQRFFLLIALTGSAFAGNRFLLEAGGCYLRPADQGYQDTYGKNIFMPEFTLGFRVIGRFYLFAGYSPTTRKGIIPVLDIDSKSKQSFLTAGAGFIVTMSKGIALRGDGGIANINYSEEALDFKVKGAKLGYYGELGLIFMVGKTLFLGASAGYMIGTDTIDDVRFKLGGPRASMSLGLLI